MSNRGLVIKDPWISKILNGEKKWEIRSSKTNIRGKICLIKSGSGKIFGEAELIDCIKLTEELYNSNLDKHCIDFDYAEVGYKSPYSWVIKNPIKYKEPKPYKHPNGAVIWVKL